MAKLSNYISDIINKLNFFVYVKQKISKGKKVINVHAVNRSKAKLKKVVTVELLCRTITDDNKVNTLKIRFLYLLGFAISWQSSIIYSF